MAEYEKTIAQMIGGCRDRGDQAQLWGVGRAVGVGIGLQDSGPAPLKAVVLDCTLKIPTRMGFMLPSVSVALTCPAWVLHRVRTESWFGHWDGWEFWILLAEKHRIKNTLNPNLV